LDPGFRHHHLGGATVSVSEPRAVPPRPAVAIPSLFGYNWLLTRVKSVIATQQVFVDELVTKLAEAFSQHEVGRRSAHAAVQPPPPPSDA
jgi:hypothetical protein